MAAIEQKQPAAEQQKKQGFFVVVGQGISRFCTAFYRYHYGVGVHTIRLMRRWKRHTSRTTTPLRRSLRYTWLRYVVRSARRLRRRIRHLLAAVPAAFRELGAAARKNVFSVFPCFFGMCRRAVHRYWDELTAIGRLLGPAVAIAVLVVTVVTWTNTDFCLSLTYQGQDLGLIENAGTYDAAAAMAKARVINEDNSFQVQEVPRLAMTVQGDRTVLSDAEVCDAILRTAGDSIAEVTGLYIDDTFIGSMVSHDELQGLLDGLKDGYYDKKDPDQRADFVQKVELVDGLYPTSTVWEGADLKEKLTEQTVVEKTYTVQEGDVLGTIAVKHDMTISELRAMNPAYANTDMVKIGDTLTVQRPQTFLRVKVIKTIRYTEEIDYNTQTIYNDDKYVTYSKVKTQGQEGSQDMVAEVTYLDGLESSRKVISKTVTKQPVTKVVEVGTKKVVSSSGNEVVQGDGVTTGSMLWPVPCCHRMSRGWQRGHYALDITNGPVPVLGKPAVAADGGVVIQASTGWNGGFGNVVKIRHSNGLVTLYAHLQSIKVVKGQQVSRGQTVGLIGSTGRSTGPHLHFEVIKNGVRVNPLNYVKP